MPRPDGVPVIDLGALRDHPGSAEAERTVRAIGDACISVGFFYVSNHGIPLELQHRLERASRAFFAHPAEVKEEIRMARAGSRWRGYFSVGEELTSGIVDQKEGIYFSRELSESETRPLHGPNQWPADPADLRPAVLDYMGACEGVGALLLRAIATYLGLDAGHFGREFAEPTLLFRIFNYPPHDEAHGEASTAVGEHTDYGYLTLLRQDDTADGLQVRSECGEWVDVPPIEDTLVVNLGDALEHNTAGLLRATPHRVTPRRGARRGRLSFPLFYDPSFGARMTSVGPLLTAEMRAEAERRRAHRPRRWDGAQLELFEGTYGEYLLSKVSKVFPDLARCSLTQH